MNAIFEALPAHSQTENGVMGTTLEPLNIALCVLRL